MPIAVNDVVRLVYFNRLYSQRLLTVLHLRCVTAPAGGIATEQALLNIANKYGAGADPLLTAWKSVVSQDFIFDEVRAQKVFPQRSIYAKAAIGDNGGDTEKALTANVAISIEKRSITANRHGIGRVQMAGCPGDVLEDGVWNSTYVGQVQTAWENLLGLQSVPADSSVYAFCLWDGNAVTSDDDLFDVQAKDTIRTMHRRTVRVGE